MDCTNTCTPKSNSYLLILVLYILLAIIIGSCIC